MKFEALSSRNSARGCFIADIERHLRVRVTPHP
jgi:hypothetical protein